MTSDPADLARNLVRAMARREASALTGSAGRLPDLAVRSVACPCGSVAGDLAEGIDRVRTGRLVDLGPQARGDAADRDLPVLTKLACERLDNRSLLPVAVVLLRHPDRPVRLRTRAVALREAGVGPSPAHLSAGPPGVRQLLPVLRRLNDEEAWWPSLPEPSPTGGDAWTLPVATHPVSSASDARGAAFLGPHWDGGQPAELDEVYRRARRDAVLRAL